MEISFVWLNFRELLLITSFTVVILVLNFLEYFNRRNCVVFDLVKRPILVNEFVVVGHEILILWLQILGFILHLSVNTFDFWYRACILFQREIIGIVNKNLLSSTYKKLENWRLDAL